MSDQDRINALRKKLYSRNRSALNEKKRRVLHPEHTQAKRAWEKRAVPEARKVKRKRSYLGLFFITSIVFFIISLLFASYFFFGGRNVVSGDNVLIEIQGPSSVGGGDELDLQITITNKNATTLELADLLVEFPEGTRSLGNIGKELVRFRESLGNIAPGKRVTKSLQAVLFGEENSEQSIAVTVEYRVAGSNAIFFTEKTYPIIISSAPISVSVRSLNEITSGQAMDFTVVVNSNSTSAVEDVVLKAEYPFGFSFDAASPSPNFSNAIWVLGDLKPEEKRTIRISGIMTGQDEEERVFRFSVGLRDELDAEKLKTTFVSNSRSVVVQRPFIGATLSLNQETKETYVFPSDTRINGQIVWKNNLLESVTDAQIEVSLRGNAVDKSSIFAQQGFYNSVTNTLRWSKDTIQELATLAPSQSGTVGFSFEGRELTGSSLRNPEIILEVTVRGKRMGDSNVPEQIDSTVVRNIKFLSDLTLTSRTLHNSGVFTNTGPLPPRAEEETTYTVVWTLTNSANHVSGVRVVGTLPQYVNWLGVVSPSDAGVSFNTNTRQVAWIAGEVPQGVGVSISPKEVSFKVAITPSLSQVGTSPVLVNRQAVNGFDQFTEVDILKSIQDVTIRLLTESGFIDGNGTVVE